MTKSLVFAVGLFAVVAINGVATAQAVEWKVSDGGNGHWYQAVPAVTYFTWSAADAEARAKGGYLVTITDGSEANFVRSLITSTPGVVRSLSGTTVGPWIGAVKDVSTLQFGWCTGEPWSYTEWAPGEPTGASWEDRICYYGGALRWNDRPGEYTGNTATPSYVLEWSADCNGDGNVDYGQILRGELSDLNGNYIPECCEQGSSCTGGSYPVQWEVSDGGNGHWYLPEDTSVTRSQAMITASSSGGYLATITSAQENQFLAMQNFPSLGGAVSYWTGGVRAAPGSGAWSWITGELWSYSNFDASEPNGCCGQDVRFTTFRTYAGHEGRWDDTSPENAQYTLIEFDSDCNGDGFVDYGQILRGELADSNVNGVPDLCESVIRVPADKASIQSAIDAATAGKTVEVSAGIYNEAIDFKGKAITVKAVGARANTIIDGTGLAGPVVRATFGEASATLLQGFTIRNGTAGSLVNGQRVGGGMFVQNASPTIRDCAFVSNSADAGGGLAAINSQSVIDGCTFSTNAAGTGGGLWLDGGRPTVSGCVVTSNTASGHGGGLYSTPMPGQLPNVVLVGNTLCSNTSADAGRENLWALFDDGGNAICDCVGDVDGNGIADTADISLALLFFGSETDPDFIQPDQDMNGTVNTGDVSLLLLNFGRCE